MKVSIMQPYFLPYIGYWQLIYNADIFIIYDDVTYIKQGWINRNKLIINDTPTYFTLQVKNVSSFKLIKDIEININPDKMLKTVCQAYCKAPMFYDVYAIIKDILINPTNNLSDFVLNSIKVISNYLGIDTKIIKSSDIFIPKHFRAEKRVKFICKTIDKAPIYINSIGGVKLYDYDDFKKEGIDLRFLKSKIKSKDTVSILDLMFRYDKKELNALLTNYKELKNGIWAV